MRSLIRFNKGMMRMPFHWQLWLLLLLTVNLVIPLFFVNRLEAQVVLATMIVNVMLMTLLTRLTGFSRLVGLGHIPWFPLLYWLWNRLDQAPAGDFFGLWIRALMVLNVLALAIDAVDVARYVAGDREETVQGL